MGVNDLYFLRLWNECTQSCYIVHCSGSLIFSSRCSGDAQGPPTAYFLLHNNFMIYENEPKVKWKSSLLIFVPVGVPPAGKVSNVWALGKRWHKFMSHFIDTWEFPVNQPQKESLFKDIKNEISLKIEQKKLWP